MSKISLFFYLFCYLTIDTNAVIISRCDLAKGLLRRGIAKKELNDWICLVESESGRNTKSVNRKNRNGSVDYGLFQLNSMYWCRGEKTKSNECGLYCKILLNDSIDPSFKCAMKVFRRHGFSAWYGWRAKCQGKNIREYTNGCKL